jgi:XisI protein
MAEKLDYGKLLREILSEKVNIVKPSSKLAEILVADDENGVYAWQAFGWADNERQSYQRFFARIKDNKIHIEEDWTEEGIGTILLERGVSPKDIVIEFHPPEMRQYTEFAIS